MTEQEWLSSTDPAALLSWRTGRYPDGTRVAVGGCPSDRKLRLFACACCRMVWHLLTDDAPCGRCGGKGHCPRCSGEGCSPFSIAAYGPCIGHCCHDCSGTGRVNSSHRAVEVAERYADGEATVDELAGAEVAATIAGIYPEMKASQAALLRDIFGNPFRPVTLPRTHKAHPTMPLTIPGDCPWLTWNDGTVPRLAEGAYEDRTAEGFLDAGRLMILADALEEAGCAEEEILWHLRGLKKCATCRGVGRRNCVVDAGYGNPLMQRAGWQHCYTCNPYPNANPSPNPGWVRSDAPHCQGCWAVDLLLGKE